MAVFPRVADCTYARCSALRAVNWKPYWVPKLRATLAGIFRVVESDRGTSSVNQLAYSQFLGHKGTYPAFADVPCPTADYNIRAAPLHADANARFKSVAQCNPTHCAGMIHHAFLQSSG